MTVTFGLAIDLRSAERSLAEQIERCAALSHLAEGLGFDIVSFGESYPVRPGGSHLSSPLLVLAGLAPRTKMRLATGVTLLPAWHPLKLAYDSVVLHQLSGERFILGVGVSSPPLQRRFGLSLTSTGDYVDEFLAALKALWNGEDGFHGEQISIEGGLGLRPSELGGPPLWVGGTLRRSVERAAAWGDGYIAATNYSYELVARQSARYRSALLARGKDPSTGVVCVNRLALLAEKEGEATAPARRYVGETLRSYARMGAFAGDPNASPADLFDAFDEDMCLVGTPSEVVARVRHYAEAGVTNIQVRVCPAEIPLEISIRTVELLGKEVLPHFK